MSELFEIWYKEMLVLLISMIPLIELRGAIPFGTLSLGLDYTTTITIAIIGNCLPVPFIIRFVRPIFEYMKRYKVFRWFPEWFERKAHRKISEMSSVTGWALLIFVAIPLPGTGAWTGALIAAYLGMRVRVASPYIMAGVAVAGGLITILTLFAGQVYEAIRFI